MVVLGLATALASYDFIEVIDTYAGGVKVLEGMAVRKPDVLLLDIQMPDITGSELAPSFLKNSRK
jgi:Response regulator containing a CheY-like receiver domain and an HTH DNA-binding domain